MSHPTATAPTKHARPPFQGMTGSGNRPRGYSGDALDAIGAFNALDRRIEHGLKITWRQVNTARRMRLGWHPCAGAHEQHELLDASAANTRILRRLMVDRRVALAVKTSLLAVSARNG